MSGFLYLPGQYPGTATNDTANAGNVGESAAAFASAGAATNTFTNGANCVVTWTGHPYKINPSGIIACGAYNVTNSGGAVPTGLTAGTNYYFVPIDANTGHLATSVANALAGTFVTTSSSGTGTNTGHSEAIITTGNPFDIGGIALTAGNWQVQMLAETDPAGSTTQSVANFWAHTVSATAPASANRLVYAWAPYAILAGVPMIAPAGPGIFSFATTTNLFFSINSTFALSTNNAYGLLTCLRVR